MNEYSRAGHLTSALACALSVMLFGGQARAQQLSGDRVGTDRGDLVIHPVAHATFVMNWNGKTIYVDPVNVEALNGLPRPDLVLLTDVHGDHLSVKTLEAVVGSNTMIVAPGAAADSLSAALRARTTVMGNGETKSILGISLLAIPMYNVTKERLAYHPKGRGNGYVLSVGGKRVYISGDTEDIPEVRALTKIDVAFVCFNLPYTMTEEQAASAVRAFSPAIVYPYHYRGSDVNKFRDLVAGAPGIEVRLGKWY